MRYVNNLIELPVEDVIAMLTGEARPQYTQWGHTDEYWKDELTGKIFNPENGMEYKDESAFLDVWYTCDDILNDSEGEWFWVLAELTIQFRKLDGVDGVFKHLLELLPLLAEAGVIN